MDPGRYLVRHGDTNYRVEQAPDGSVRVEGNDAPFQVTPLDSGTFRIDDGNENRVVYVTGPPDAREIFVDGEVFHLEVVAEGGGVRRRRSGAAALESLAAPMPATVVKILVTPGQMVRHGQTLVTLEAMKMELPIRAPRDGAVGRILCREGELVQPGVRLLEMS